MAKNKMLCILGRQDIPIIQEQPEFAVDLLESNIILFGVPMSGKTNFIKLLVTILHKQYRVESEQIFILDFGGALAEFKNLPLVAAYFDNANEEYVKRVFKLIEEQLKDNIKKLKGENYKEASENLPIHTTLCIDNINAFLDEPRYNTYREKLAKFCRDGLSKGITVVITASITKGIIPFMSSFKQKIALEMPEDNYTEIFNHKIIPVSNRPGHGFANVTVNTADNTATYPMQTAYEIQLNIADSISTLEFKENIDKYFRNKTVKKYECFPEILTEKDYDEFITKNGEKIRSGNSQFSISVGLDYKMCKPVIVDFENTKVVAIYGKKGSGKTNLLRRFMKVLVSNQLYEFVLFDDGRGQLNEFRNRLSDSRAEYIQHYIAEDLPFKNTKESWTEKVKLSPMQQFIKVIHEKYLDLSRLRRMGNLVMNEVFNSGIDIPSKTKKIDRKNVVFILQSKFLYVNSIAAKIFMEIILPLLVAQAEEMNWIFIFTDVKVISDSDTRDNFHSVIGTAVLFDDIAEFVENRGSKSVFGNMEAKSLKEEYARCEEGDGYMYSIERDDLKKLKFIREEKEEE